MFVLLLMFFSSHAGFLFFLGGYLGLKRPDIFGELKPPRKRLGKGTLNTCAKVQGLTLNNVNIWTFVRLSAKITA